MTAEEDLKKLSLQRVLSPHEIKISHMDHRGRKTTKLVGNTTSSNYIKSQNRTYEFEFEEPLFISHIQFKTVEYADGSKANFSCTYFPTGEKERSQPANANNAWTVRINGFITKFSIEPPKKYLGEQLLTAVEIVGLNPREFSEVSKQVGAIENLRQSVIEKCQERLDKVTARESEISSLERKITELDETITQLTGQKAELENGVELTQNTLKEVERSVGSKKQELSEYSSRIETAASSIEQKTEERRQLSAEITRANSELRELKENINMFPTEISGFVAQGASSIRRYTALAAIPIIVIGIVTFDLFVNASNLSQFNELPENMPIWEIILARFPYVLVCGALLVVHAENKVT